MSDAGAGLGLKSGVDGQREAVETGAVSPGMRKGERVQAGFSIRVQALVLAGLIAAGGVAYKYLGPREAAAADKPPIPVTLANYENAIPPTGWESLSVSIGGKTILLNSFQNMTEDAVIDWATENSPENMDLLLVLHMYLGGLKDSAEAVAIKAESKKIDENTMALLRKNAQ